MSYLRKNMERILIILLLSFAVSAPVLAASDTTSTSVANATRLYVGAQLGDSIAGGLLGLQINKTYSLEVRYDYIDTVYQPNNTVKASSKGIAGIGLYPLKIGDMDQFYIFGKAGYERTTTKSTTTYPVIPGLPIGATTTVTTTVRKRTVIGAGVQYDFSSNFSGRIGMNAVGGDHSTYIAAIYKF
jgi:hypothetical protein